MHDPAPPNRAVDPSSAIDEDAEFLRLASWSDGVSRPLRRAAEKGQVEVFGRRLLDLWSEVPRRSEPVAPAAWLAPIAGESGTALPTPLLRAVLVETSAPRPKRARRSPDDASGETSASHGLADWLLDGAPVTQDDALDPAVPILLAEATWRTRRTLAPHEAVRLWRRVRETLATSAEAVQDEAGCRVAPALRRLLAAELASLSFGPAFGTGSDESESAAIRTEIAQTLLDGTDTDGSPQGGLVEILPEWIAGFVRIVEWGRRFASDPFAKESAERFRALVRLVAPWCRADGGWVGEIGAAGANDAHAARDARGIVEHAARLAGCRSRSTTLRLLEDLRSPTWLDRPAKATAPTRGKKGAGPGGQSDESQVATLLGTRDVRSDRLVVAFDRRAPLVDLVLAGIPFAAGPWDLSVSLDGEPVVLEEDWACTCWHSDSDGDYVELQTTVADGVRIERQVFLSAKDRFLLLADCIAGAGTRRIATVSRLPLVAGTTGSHVAGLREVQCAVRRLAVRCYPLALPQDRLYGTTGDLRCAADRSAGRDAGGNGQVAADGSRTGRECGDEESLGLELRQESVGGLFAPLVLDWSPKRAEAPVDWRTLTVTEDGRVLRTDAASGHRVRVGKQQWIVYRSLTKGRQPRAVLGLHTAHETVVGRFETTGHVTPLLLVE